MGVDVGVDVGTHEQRAGGAGSRGPGRPEQHAGLEAGCDKDPAG